VRGGKAAGRGFEPWLPRLFFERGRLKTEMEKKGLMAVSFSGMSEIDRLTQRERSTVS
jgi:hypothetical protein